MYDLWALAAMMVTYTCLVIVGGLAVGAILVWWFLSPLRMDTLTFVLPDNWLPPKDETLPTDDRLHTHLIVSGKIPGPLVKLLWCEYCLAFWVSLVVTLLFLPLTVNINYAIFLLPVLVAAKAAAGLLILKLLKR